MVDWVTVVGMSQGVYLSAEMAEQTGVEGIQMVDRVSTEGLRVDGVSTEAMALDGEAVGGEAVDGEKDKRQLKVGDICRYVGSGLKMLKGLNQLRIEAIEQEVVIVKGSGWYVTQQVSLRDLERISSYS